MCYKINFLKCQSQENNICGQPHHRQSHANGNCIFGKTRNYGIPAREGAGGRGGCVTCELYTNYVRISNTQEKLIQRFRLIIIVLVNRCIESHEKLKKCSFAVEVIGVIGQFVFHEVESPIGVFLHRLHQHVNSFPGGHFILFQGDEIDVGKASNSTTLFYFLRANLKLCCPEPN